MAEKCKPTRERLFCPYCEEEIAEASFPYCQACQVEIFYCPECRKPIPREKQTCPSCGADIRGEAAKGG
jgi:Zn-finger nucleic acid-binding protein